MSKIPNNYRQFRNRPIGYMQPKSRRPRFRWWIVLIPSTCLFAAWIIHSVDPPIGWNDILELSGVRYCRAYSMLAVLCLAMIAFLLIKRVLGRGKK